MNTTSAITVRTALGNRPGPVRRRILRHERRNTAMNAGMRHRFISAAVLVAVFTSLMMSVATAASAAIVGNPQTVGGTLSLRAIACGSPTTCEAVGYDAVGGVVVAITNGVPGAAQRVPGTDQLMGVACPTATTCMVVGRSLSGGVFLVTTNGVPGLADPVPGTQFLFGVACPTARNCEAVGEVVGADGSPTGAAVNITDAIPSAPQLAPGTYFLTSIACSSTPTCLTVGGGSPNTGVVVPVTLGAPGARQVVSGANLLYGLTCTTTISTCVAVGNSGTPGLIVPINNGIPGVGQTVAGTYTLRGIACATATVCEGVGAGLSPTSGDSTGGAVTITDGGAGTFQLVAGTQELLAVACPTADTCVAVGDNGSVISSLGVVVSVTGLDSDLAITGIPANVTTDATSPSGASVTYPAPSAADAPGTGSGPTLACDHTSGSTFAIGTTAVTCTASDSDDTPSTVSASFTVTVRPLVTSTVLASSANPSVSGQNVIYTATVTVNAPGSGTPVGSVAFNDGNAPVSGCSAVSLNAGVATCAVTYPGTAGSPHAVTAAYGAGAVFSGSTSNTISQVVNKAATATGLVSSLNPSVTGQKVVYTATVSVNAPGSGIPGGTIAFNDGTSVIAGCAAVPVTAGTATCPVTYPGTAGSPHSISAAYNGDADFVSSTAASLIQVVNKAPTKLMAAPMSHGPLTLTFSATLTRIYDSAPLGAKTVTFSIFGHAACSATTNANGVASCTVLGLSLGGGSYTATYAGDANYLGATASAML